MAVLNSFKRAAELGIPTDRIKAEFMPVIEKFTSEEDFSGCEIYFNGLYIS